MIQRLSHATIYVLDQEAAKQFYVEKLGFDVGTDFTMEGGFRWLTVRAAGQPGVEIILMPAGDAPMQDPEVGAKLRELVQAGAMGTGVFETDNCQQTYDELRARGVEFMQPPTDQMYGIEATFKDNSGNWFSLTQPKAWQP